MKALEPVLRFHFWILLGVGLILAIAGWWMTTSSMQAATATARGEIDKADKDKNVGEVPSDDWTKNLAAINVDQKALVDRTREKLYALQKERMVWPEVIAEAASKLKYREDFKDPILHTNYRDDYYKEVERVYKIPRPIDPVEDTGIVFFPASAMPHKEWGDHTPTSQQMWDSMEDLWLLEPLLQAIYETNGGETAQRHEAIIVAIEYIGLKGGDRSKIGQSSEPMGGGDGMMGAGAMGPGAMGPGGMGEMKAAGDRGGPSGAGGIEGSASISTDIKESEELGDPGQPADQGGGAGAAAGAMPGPGAMPADIKGGMGGGFSDPDAGRRWIDAPEEGLPYRTRGFKLTVLMDHRKVPDLYAQLTSSERSPWPVQILRMNVARLSDSGAFAPGMAGGAGAEAGFGAGPVGFAPGGAGAGGFGPGAGGLRPAAGGFGPGAGAGAGALPRRGRPGADFDDVRPGAGAKIPSSNDQMANPFLARVTVVGLITLYNEPPPAESTGDAPPAETPSSEPSAEQAPGPTAATEQPAEEMPEGEPQPTAETDDPEKPAAAADEPATTDDAPEKKPAGDDEPSDSEPSTDKPKSQESDSGTEKPKAEESDTDKPGDEKPSGEQPADPDTESKPE